MQGQKLESSVEPVRRAERLVERRPAGGRHDLAAKLLDEGFAGAPRAPSGENHQTRLDRPQHIPAASCICSAARVRHPRSNWQAKKARRGGEGEWEESREAMIARRAALALAGALALGTALGGCLGYDGDFDRGYQVDPETLSQIKIGSTTKQEALAHARHAFDDLDRRRRRLVLHRPEDASGARLHARPDDRPARAGGLFRQERQGRRASPITACRTARCSITSRRTTPTGGQEPDFLRNIMAGLVQVHLTPTQTLFPGCVPTAFQIGASPAASLERPHVALPLVRRAS